MAKKPFKATLCDLYRTLGFSYRNRISVFIMLSFILTVSKIYDCIRENIISKIISFLWYIEELALLNLFYEEYMKRNLYGFVVIRKKKIILTGKEECVSALKIYI